MIFYYFCPAYANMKFNYFGGNSIFSFFYIITYNELLAFLMSFKNFVINPFEDDLKMLQYTLIYFLRQRKYDDG